MLQKRVRRHTRGLVPHQRSISRCNRERSSPQQRARRCSRGLISTTSSQQIARRRSRSIREGVAVGEFFGPAESHRIRERVNGGHRWKARRCSRELLAAASEGSSPSPQQRARRHSRESLAAASGFFRRRIRELLLMQQIVWNSSPSHQSTRALLRQIRGCCSHQMACNHI